MEQHYPEEKIIKIVRIVENISFKNELDNNKQSELFPEFKVVQDADRLDAIGAIGLTIFVSFGSEREREREDFVDSLETNVQ
jgi:uncharacterized protein